MNNYILTTYSPAGPVIFAQSMRARRLSITIKPFKPVRVSFPLRMSLNKAQEFFESKLEWVKRTVDKMKEFERQRINQAALPEINKTIAKINLKAQLKFLADKYKFSYNRVFIRNQKTRWGSCSNKNNINLNINLVRLPQELQDYVLLHELVHTRIKNHSRKFWLELDKYAGDAKKTAKKLRNHSVSHCAA